MAIPPFYINQGASKRGRDLVDASNKVSDNFSLLKRERDAMIQQKNRAGTLSTRTNNTDGTLTLDAGHGVSTGDVIDVEWSGGARAGVTVGTVNGQSVPISGGTGDNLPAQSTAVTAIAWALVAGGYQFLSGPSGSGSATVAKAAFLELDSFVSNTSAALEQFCARMRQ